MAAENPVANAGPVAKVGPAANAVRSATRNRTSGIEVVVLIIEFKEAADALSDRQDAYPTI